MENYDGVWRVPPEQRLRWRGAAAPVVVTEGRHERQDTRRTADQLLAAASFRPAERPVFDGSAKSSITVAGLQ